MTPTPTTGSGARKRPASPPSQQLHLRLPRELHGLLSEEARRQGVSINNLGVSLIAGALSWRAQASEKGR